MIKIFCDDCKPLMFYFPSEILKKEMSWKVETLGGIVSEKLQKTAIVVITKNLSQILLNEDLRNTKLYHVDFINDSILKQSIQPLEKYELVLLPFTKDKLRKYQYTANESLLIKNYAKERFGNPNAIGFWQRAINSGISFGMHSASSVRSH